MKNHCQDFLWHWGHSCPQGSSSWGCHYSSHLARAFLDSPSSYAGVGVGGGGLLRCWAGLP